MSSSTQFVRTEEGGGGETAGAAGELAVQQQRLEIFAMDHAAFDENTREESTALKPASAKLGACGEPLAVVSRDAVRGDDDGESVELARMLAADEVIVFLAEDHAATKAALDAACVAGGTDCCSAEVTGEVRAPFAHRADAARVRRVGTQPPPPLRSTVAGVGGGGREVAADIVEPPREHWWASAALVAALPVALRGIATLVAALQVVLRVIAALVAVAEALVTVEDDNTVVVDSTSSASFLFARSRASAFPGPCHRGGTL